MGHVIGKRRIWIYFYNSSKLNELVGFAMKWIAKQHEAASLKALEVAAATKVNILVRDKVKRNIVDHMEKEQSCMFRADPLVQKVTFAIEEKRQHSIK